MDETTTALNDLLDLGMTPTNEEASAETKAEDEATEELTEDEESDSTDSEDSTEESEEESDSDEEEQPTEAHAGNLKKALKAEREISKDLKNRVKQLEDMLHDADFIEKRAQTLKAGKDTSDTNPQAQAELPFAPFYPNTERGAQRYERDAEQAILEMPELRTDGRLGAALRGYIQEGLSVPEAVKTLQGIMGLKANEFRKEGEKEKEAQVAKKARMSTEMRPRSGTPSRTEQLRRAVHSGSESEKIIAGAELLGLT